MPDLEIWKPLENDVKKSRLLPLKAVHGIPQDFPSHLVVGTTGFSIALTHHFPDDPPLVRTVSDSRVNPVWNVNFIPDTMENGASLGESERAFYSALFWHSFEKSIEEIVRLKNQNPHAFIANPNLEIIALPHTNIILCKHVLKHLRLVPNAITEVIAFPKQAYNAEALNSHGKPLPTFRFEQNTDGSIHTSDGKTLEDIFPKDVVTQELVQSWQYCFRVGVHLLADYSSLKGLFLRSTDLVQKHIHHKRQMLTAIYSY